jgi:hypothetical protein
LECGDGQTEKSSGFPPNPCRLPLPSAVCRRFQMHTSTHSTCSSQSSLPFSSECHTPYKKDTYLRYFRYGVRSRESSSSQAFNTHDISILITVYGGRLYEPLQAQLSREILVYPLDLYPPICATAGSQLPVAASHPQAGPAITPIPPFQSFPPTNHLHPTKQHASLPDLPVFGLPTRASSWPSWHAASKLEGRLVQLACHDTTHLGSSSSCVFLPSLLCHSASIRPVSSFRLKSSNLPPLKIPPWPVPNLTSMAL